MQVKYEIDIIGGNSGSQHEIDIIGGNAAGHNMNEISLEGILQGHNMKLDIIGNAAGQI
jgi:hypothetical protein